MQKMQRGFTLIELVVVIVVLGILSAVAVPKYIDYKESAGAAAVKGLAATLSSAAASNYAAYAAGVTAGIAMSDCTKIPELLTEGSLPSGYTITVVGTAGAAAAATTAASAATGGSATTIGKVSTATMTICTLTNPEFKATANFSFSPT